ncbi:MAG: cytochrome c [Myxococcales bacterium]|nr:cytochrome c [Myxococcales bacterium]MDD9968415.1 cytochrome c [Myxococcales bacterium]
MRMIVWMAALCVVAGCGGGGGAEEGGSDETSGGDVSQYEGPIASTDTAKGEEIFLTYCDDCHPDGGADSGPSLIDHPHAVARVRQQIREGSGKMRPFSAGRLSDEDMEHLLAYLNTLGAVE